ncbi:class I SAM-dependent methyltransferase [Roseateles asaccharophilus]|uniref:Cephalosporin hydroxylase n=1 Tax=Roseateles asaccharophilus TaxID=582607 RepID=A0ABU2ABQ2_9BURK|nr:class I SAM-dependent methyltransferase [Roseateles asaccharophilus]MDR7334639.1 cephalosporin hydroxylase [Roseateles asaccharophilus]
MNLWQDFKTNDQKLVHKWVHYFPIYERHLAPFRNRTITLLEIGVFKGGSLQMWQRFLGPLATIVGIDINPECKQHEEPGIHVRIGDQSDPKFLQSLIDEFGTFDIVIDDGSHKMNHLVATFEFLYPRIAKNGLYIAEDLHTCYWPEYGGGVNEPGSFVNVSKSLVDKLNADHSRGAIEADFVARNTFGISFYDSVIVYERGTIPVKAAPTIGRG